MICNELVKRARKLAGSDEEAIAILLNTYAKSSDVEIPEEGDLKNMARLIDVYLQGRIAAVTADAQEQVSQLTNGSVLSLVDLLIEGTFSRKVLKARLGELAKKFVAFKLEERPFFVKEDSALKAEGSGLVLTFEVEQEGDDEGSDDA